MNTFGFDLLMNNKKLFIGACVLTAGLYAFNRYTERLIANLDTDEEFKERLDINRLKSKLPKSVLKRYSLKKN